MYGGAYFFVLAHHHQQRVNRDVTLDVQVTVFAVGVGTNVNEEELRAIASAPKCNHVYLLAAFRDVAAFIGQIMSGACKGENRNNP